MILLQNDLPTPQDDLLLWLIVVCFGVIATLSGGIVVLYKQAQNANKAREAQEAEAAAKREEREDAAEKLRQKREDEDRKYNREQQEKVHGTLERIENEYQERFAKVLEHAASTTNEFVGVKKDIEHIQGEIKEIKSKIK